MKAFGKSKTHYGLALSLDFDPQGAFLCMVVSPLSQKRWEQRSLNHLLKQSFAYLCPSRDSYLDNSHDYYLQCLQEKHWLFTLFLLLLTFWRANRRLIVNALTGAHLSLVSRNANSSKCPA